MTHVEMLISISLSSCPENGGSHHNLGMPSTHRICFKKKKNPGNSSSRSFTVSTQEISNR